MATEAWNNSGRLRVYDAVKARIIAHELPIGKRILVEPLADQLYLSNTPVREALIQLAAERLINDVPKAGFFTKEISEAEIRDLYTLYRLLLDWALSVTRNDGQVPGMLKPPKLFDEGDPPEESTPRASVRIMNELFVHIAGQTGNADIIHLVGNINDRTYFIRLKEFELYGDEENELPELCRSYYQKEIGKLQRDLRAYLDKKIAMLPGVLLLLRGEPSRTGRRRRIREDNRP